MESLGGNDATTQAPLDPARASQQGGAYPRPQLVRTRWAELGGTWAFAFDDADHGLAERWFEHPDFDHGITVPYPPESPLSGIADRGFHPIVWYARRFGANELAQAGADDARPRTLIHFGAVDYRADVWLDGRHLGSHEGGHTPFSFDITGALAAAPGAAEHVLVVRAADDPADVAKPRGKQDWQLAPHDIWYDRTTGIWQPVWLEAVPETSVAHLRWSTDIGAREVRLELRVAGPLPSGATATIRLAHEGVPLAEVAVGVTSASPRIALDLPAQANGQLYEKLLWSPEHPRLIDATVELSTGDLVGSYLGLRSVGTDAGHFLLNDRPYYVRSVLSQGFWPESHLAAPSPDALRCEAQLIKDLGFNAARVHQKIEDPRFLYWADRLGLLLWEEMPSAYEFSPAAVARGTREWLEAVDRDVSHPSIVTWVPLNESWGVQHIAHDPAMRGYARGLVGLTKALDPSRPVVSNDGWEHVDSDILSIHDYEGDGEIVRARYADADAVGALLGGLGPAGRRMLLDGHPQGSRPVMLTEFGGVAFSTAAGSWGYTSAADAGDYRARVAALVDGTLASRVLAGYCYTQLTDTQQETNGLLDENRVPKLPLEDYRRIFGARRG